MATSLKESVSLYFLRDGSCLRFTMDELTVNDEDDWFLPLLIKNTNTLNTTRFVEILEDRNSVLSIIESIRYMKLILFKDVELEYLLALVTKWCVPIWLIEEIDEKIKEKEIFNSDYEKRFKTFLDFTLAIENKRTPQALRWFFKILDIDKCGFINVETIRLFFRCVMDRMVDIDYSAADVIDEIFDMVKPKRKDRITLKDLIDSGVGHTIVSILIDVNGFWAYDNRETLIAGPLNDDGNIDNTFGNISLNH